MRSNIRQPERLHDCDSTGVPDLNNMRSNRYDRLSLKCAVEGRARSFKSGFFFRTHIMWNDLPTDLKEVTESGSFKSALKKHLWDLMLEPD